jgi:hypothetical protein
LRYVIVRYDLGAALAAKTRILWKLCAAFVTKHRIFLRLQRFSYAISIPRLHPRLWSGAILVAVIVSLAAIIVKRFSKKRLYSLLFVTSAKAHRWSARLVGYLFLVNVASNANCYHVNGCFVYILKQHAKPANRQSIAVAPFELPNIALWQSFNSIQNPFPRWLGLAIKEFYC